MTSATGPQVGTPGYKSLEAVQGNAESPLWLSDVTAFGKLMDKRTSVSLLSLTECRSISSLMKDCVAVTSMVRPYSEKIYS